MLLRRRRILAIWAAQLLSVLGDRFYGLAIMWLALERSGPAAMGAVAIAESIPFIVLGAFGHRVLQRCASFPILAAIDTARALLVIVLPVVWTVGGTAAMLATVAVLGTLGAVFDPSLSALVPDLVDELERPALVAAMDLAVRIARIAGPALAGVALLFVPVAMLFAADALTFVISTAALIFLTKIGTATIDTTTAASAVTSQTRARAILREHPSLGAAFTVHAAGFFLNALTAIGLPLLLAHQLDTGPAAYGWILTATGVAALAGNLAAARMRPSVVFLPRFCATWAVTGVLLAATGAVDSVAWVMAFASLSGFVTPFISITLSAQLASHAHPIRLRLFAINHMVMRSAGTLGMAAIPTLIAAAPARGFVLGGTALALIASTGWVIAATSGKPGRDVNTATESV